MRILKFRAWNPTRNEMLDPIKLSDLAKRPAISEGLVDGLIFNQFTGLQDKNGIEIFEGDIVAIYTDTTIKHGFLVKENDYEIHSVKYLNGGFFTSEDDDLTLGFYIDSVEIIGNIHESPELLK